MLNQLCGGKRCSLEVILEMPPLAVFFDRFLKCRQKHFNLIYERAEQNVGGRFCFTLFNVIDLPGRMQQNFQLCPVKHTAGVLESHRSWFHWQKSIMIIHVSLDLTNIRVCIKVWENKMTEHGLAVEKSTLWSSNPLIFICSSHWMTHYTVNIKIYGFWCRIVQN